MCSPRLTAPFVFLLIGLKLHAAPPAFTPLPPAHTVRKAPTTTQSPAGQAAEQQKRVNAFLNNLSPAQKKSLAKAWKKMTPEQRQQFAATVKRQLAAGGPAK